MKATIERDHFLKALKHVSDVASGGASSADPVESSHALIRFEGDRLRVSGTGGDQELTMSVPADVDSSGEATVPARGAHEILRRSAAGASVEATMSKGANRVTLRVGERGKFELVTLPPGDLPKMSDDDDLSEGFDVSSSELLRLIESCRSAIPVRDRHRYYLGGMYFHAKPKGGGFSSSSEGSSPMLRGAATDGHRLSCCETECSASASESALLPDSDDEESRGGVIVPTRMVGILRQILQDAADEAGGADGESSEGSSSSSARIRTSRSKISIRVGDVDVVSKLVDGTFPDYERVIPSEDENRRVVSVSRSVLSPALERVSAIAASSEASALRLALEGGRMALRMNAPDVGEAEDAVEVSDSSSDAFEIGFNHVYLRDAIRSCAGETIVMRFADSGAPASVRAVEDPSAIHVVMPMRI